MQLQSMHSILFMLILLIFKVRQVFYYCSFVRFINSVIINEFSLIVKFPVCNEGYQTNKRNIFGGDFFYKGLYIKLYRDFHDLRLPRNTIVALREFGKES